MSKRIIAAILLIIMIFALSSCGKQSNKSGQNEITLKWVFAGPGEQRDSQEVWNRFNEKLQDYMPGVTIKFECIPHAEYEEKWKLMSTSQEKVDIVWHGWMIPYASEVKKGSYMELDELTDKYAPKIKAEFPKAILDKQRVNGKLYSIPNLQQMVSYVSTMSVPVDLYEKYKDKINTDELTEYFSSHKKMDKDLWNKLEEYILMFKDGGDLRQGVFGFENHVEKGYEWIINPYKVEEYAKNPSPVNLYRTEEFKTFVEVYSDWYKKGYIRKDILTADNVAAGKNEGKYCLMGDGNFLVGQDVVPRAAEINRLKGLNQIAAVKIPFYKDHYIPFAPSATNTAISTTSQNPETAMKLINLMMTEDGAELYNFLVYGIQDRHYKKMTDKEVEPIGYATQATSDSPYGLYKYVMGNTYNAYEIYAEDKNKLQTNDFIKKVNSDANPSVLQGFSLDTEPIKIELAQVNAVKGEFLKTLNSGAAPDAMGLYNQFTEKLIKAGDDKVIAEMKKQIDEYLLNNK